MSHAKRKHRNESPILQNGRIPGFDVSPWVERATEMLNARPALTIGIALGAGFLLGLSVVSKLGRVAIVGALGIGAELLQQRMRELRAEVRDDHVHHHPAPANA